MAELNRNEETELNSNQTEVLLQFQVISLSFGFFNFNVSRI